MVERLEYSSTLRPQVLDSSAKLFVSWTASRMKLITGCHQLTFFLLPYFLADLGRLGLDCSCGSLRGLPLGHLGGADA